MENQFVNDNERFEQDEMVKKYQRKRKKIKIKLALTGLIMCVIGLIFIILYKNLNTETYINCTENSELNYKAYLNENDFYDEYYLEKGTNIIASLIKNIEINFNYDMAIDQEIEYIYDYDIIAKLEVLEGNDEDIVLEKEEKLVEVEKQTCQGNKLNINKVVDIDYGAYNDKLSKFVTTYSLKDIKNRLVLTMHLHVINPYDGTQINKSSDVLTIKIPLTTQTVDVEISTNATESVGQILINKKESKQSKIFLYVGYVLVVLGGIELIRCIKYTLNVRSAETMYEQTLKKITVGYKTYIQEITSDINENDYEKIEVSSFNNLVEMRDVVNAPILMHIEAQYRTKFLIIDDKRMFVYILDANLIREKLREASRKKNNK